MKTVEERIKYYCGKWYDTKFVMTKELQALHTNFITDKILMDIPFIFTAQSPRNNDYYNDFHNYVEKLINENEFLVQFGDHLNTTVNIPLIIKARNDKDSILMKLNTPRHWNFWTIVEAKDIKWKDKKEEVIWRGVPTGSPNHSQNPRIQFVKRYFEKYNIAFNNNYRKDPELHNYTKNTVNIMEQMKYKYIVSIQGNDVATNLKWILYSNSVVLMPKCTIESWCMEFLLEPFVHYVPLNDTLNNLDEVLEWCKNHDEECKQIAENGKKWMLQFKDSKREEEIITGVLKRYCENVSYE